MPHDKRSVPHTLACSHDKRSVPHTLARPYDKRMSHILACVLSALVLSTVYKAITTRVLCRCKTCCGLLRPHVVWFGEGLDSQVLKAVDDALKKCDLCLLVSMWLIYSLSLSVVSFLVLIPRIFCLILLPFSPKSLNSQSS